MDMTGAGQAWAMSGQLVVLGVVAATAGLGPVGWTAGIAFGAIAWALLTTALHRAGRARLGPADLVTGTRVLLAGAVTALVADGATGAAVPVAALVGLTLAGIVLDGVDGQVARRTGTASPLGARFDMEVDSALVLVLSVHVALLVGPWALAIGLMRYAWVAASWALPWLRGSLAPRISAKAVAVLQAVALVAAASMLLPIAVATALVAVALAALVWSFGRSAVTLFRSRTPAGTGVREQADQLVGPPAA